MEEKKEQEKGEIKDVSLTPSEEVDLNKAVEDILADLIKTPPKETTQQEIKPPESVSSERDDAKKEIYEEKIEPLKSNEILSAMMKEADKVESDVQKVESLKPKAEELPLTPKKEEKEFSIFGEGHEQKILTKEDEVISEIDRLIEQKELAKEEKLPTEIKIVKITLLQRVKISTAKIVGRSIRLIILFFLLIFTLLKNTFIAIAIGTKSFFKDKELIIDFVIVFVGCIWLIYFFLFGSILGLVLFFVFVAPIFIQKIVEMRRTIKTP